MKSFCTCSILCIILPSPGILLLNNQDDHFYYFYLHKAKTYLLYLLPQYDCFATIEEKTIPWDVLPHQYNVQGCSSVLMSVSSKKLHTIWMHVGFAFECKCVCSWVWIRGVHCSVDQSAVISFKPFLSPFCSMAYSAFIWITSKTKLGKTEAGISQFSFYPPVFKNANIWHSE